MKALVALFAILFAASLALATLPQDYQSLSAEEKQSLLWKEIDGSRYANLPKMSFKSDRNLDPQGKGSHWLNLLRSGFNLGKAFSPTGDELAQGRIKVIHMFGAAAAVEFVPARNPVFTGLLADAGPALVRLSLAMPLESVGKFIPGMAIKFFVDGQASKNLTVMEKLEGQGDDRNFFANAFTNWLPDPIERNTIVGRWVFERFVDDAIHLKVDHLARVSATGRAIAQPVAPQELVFKPVASMDKASADFRAELAKLPVGTELYKIYGRVTAGVGPDIYIGRLVTTTNFVSGPYEDQKLYFQHDGTNVK